MSLALSSAIVAFLLAVIWGDPIVAELLWRRMGKRIRPEETEQNQRKAGTPTMGGVVFLIPVLSVTVALNLANFLSWGEWGLAGERVGHLAPPASLTGKSMLVPLAAMVGYALIGALDDWVGLRRRQDGQGLSARAKLAYQVLLATVTAMVLFRVLDLHSVAVPTRSEKMDLGWAYVPIAAFIIVATSNAVNLTDGLDALAASTSATAFGAYGVIAYLQGQFPLMAFCFTMVGALLGFLRYNAHPAHVFMGDTGSLALGAAMAVVALLSGQWLLLPVIGFVFVAETWSVCLQVAWFRWTKWRVGAGRRIFRKSPLHYHFELLGWPEQQVVRRFVIIGLLAAALGAVFASV